LQEANFASRILGAFAPNIWSFYTTGYITPLTPLIPHCVHHIVSLHEKFNMESVPKIMSFYTTVKNTIRSERVKERKEEYKLRRHVMIKSE
jgi:hypothetical protein